MKKQRSNIEIFDKKLEQTKNLVDRISSHDVGEVTIITLNKIIEAIEFLAKEVKELKNDDNMNEGDKFIHTDILGKKHEVTYTGTRRIVKDCEFEFFVDDKGDSCFFTDTEVKKMKKKSCRIYP